jgi:hypothetical protein
LEPLDIWLAETKAIASDRNLAPAYAEKGHHMIATGRASEAPALLEQAIRLDPHDPGGNIRQWQMFNAYAHLAQWEQAIDWRQKSAASNPALFWRYFELTGAVWVKVRNHCSARIETELRPCRDRPPSTPSAPSRLVRRTSGVHQSADVGGTRRSRQLRRFLRTATWFGPKRTYHIRFYQSNQD